MLIPVRCFSCNKVVAKDYNRYRLLITGDDAISPEQALNQLGYKRYCCRRMLYCHKDYIDEMLIHEQEFKFVKIY